MPNHNFKDLYMLKQIEVLIVTAILLQLVFYIHNSTLKRVFHTAYLAKLVYTVFYI